MQAFTMRHLTLTVPHAGPGSGELPLGPLNRVRAELADHGFHGWTETRGTGYWHGRPERVTVVTLYAPEVWAPACRGDILTRRVLGEIGRRAMPREDAIQVTDHGPITLTEA